MQPSFKILRRSVCVVGASAMVALGLFTVSLSASGASAVTKTTVTFAEQIEDAPNFIFPYMSGEYYTTANITQFQYLMFRPLYWFGGHASVVLNTKLSLADAPVFSNNDKTVKITLKGYTWSDGTPVDATDVMFWMNLWKMKPTGYAGWFPGGLSMPTSVTGVKITSPTTLTIKFDRSFNPHWLLYNELSQITPLPLAWTKATSAATSGSAGCAKAAYGTDATACKAVYTYLSEQSGYNPTKPTSKINALPTYSTNPLWKVVDGPWELTSFAPTADVVLKPNPAYSGTDKPKIKKFVEKPFTSTTAEFNALVSGTVDIGYLPFTEIQSPAVKPAKPGAPLTAGKNNSRLTTYVLTPFYAWQVRWFPFNFRSNGDTGNAGKIFAQLYIRQAMQRLVDQTLYVNRIYKGYGFPAYGPVPTLPKNPYTSAAELKNPYPYSLAAAKKLLSSHGWKVVPGGTSTCEKPGAGAGECGKGIKKGAKLSFALMYIAGTTALRDLSTAEKSSWSEAGINVSLSSGSVPTVVGDMAPCPKGCSWELNGTVDWTYLPDIYPSGEEIFESGAGANNGLFTTAHDNTLIKATDVSGTKLTKYENYLEKELPVIWEPEPVTLYEVNKGLQGVTPLDPLTAFTPTTYHWT